MGLSLIVDQNQYKPWRVSVDNYADDDAIDGSLPLDLDPGMLTAGRVSAVRALGDGALDRFWHRQPLLSELPIVRLGD